MVDTYIDINLPVPDAMAASKLCGPDGACKYILRSKDTISKDWLVQSVASGASQVFSTAMANTLSLPLLWAAFEDYQVKRCEGETANTYIPIVHHTLKERILVTYCREYGALPAEFQNSVCKVPILPQGFGAQLHMIKLHTGSDDPGADKVSGNQSTGVREAVPAGSASRQSVSDPETATAILSQ